MSDVFMLCVSAYLIGLGSTLHPCPLTTNLALFSVLSSWARPGARTISYICTFVAAYVATLVLLLYLITLSLTMYAEIALFMRQLTRYFMGPILIVIGMLQTGLLRSRKTTRDSASTWIFLKKVQPGFLSAGGLGILFALAFCPLTAALFFGVLTPLAISQNSLLLIPVFYGAGVLSPLLVLVAIVMRGLLLMDRAQGLPRHLAQKITIVLGVVLILIGITLVVNDIFWFQ